MDQETTRTITNGLAMDFARRTLYCRECGDYVYDSELHDRIVIEEILRCEKSKFVFIL